MVTGANEADKGRPEEAGSEDAGSEAAATEKKPSTDVFIPTEEISEDFAVSFPVDI